MSLVGPDGLVVELPSIPHDFIHELGQTDRVAGGTGAGGFKGARGGIGDVRFVVGGVNVFAVPAASNTLVVVIEGRGLTGGNGELT